jgi:hypothetical protein
MTTSRTGMVLIAFVYLYEIILKIKKIHLTYKVNDKRFMMCLLAMVGIILFVILCNYFSISFFDGISQKFHQLFTRMLGLFNDTSEYGVKRVDPHKLYFYWIPNTLENSSIHQLFIGSGTRISGWMFTQIYHRFPNYGPWNVECDFIALLLGNGILGFFTYYTMLASSYIYSKSEAQKKIIIIFIVGSLFYQFFSSTIGFLLIVFSFNKSSLDSDENNLRRSKQNFNLT